MRRPCSAAPEQAHAEQGQRGRPGGRRHAVVLKNFCHESSPHGVYLCDSQSPAQSMLTRVWTASIDKDESDKVTCLLNAATINRSYHRLLAWLFETSASPSFP